MTKKELEKEIKEANAQADRILEKLKSRASSGKNKAILAILSTDPSFIRGLQNLFSDAYHLKIFHKAEDFLQALQRISADAAILDTASSNNHSFELLRQIENIKPDLPIVVQRGCPWDGAETKAKEPLATEPVQKIDIDKIEKLKEFTKSPAKAYQDVKTNLAKNLLEDFTKRRHCRYSALFDQNEGKLLNWMETITMRFKDIAKQRSLMPFCRISHDLNAIRKEENRTLCPFHMDVNPSGEPKLYNTGDFSSYQCAYYQYAASARVEQRIIDSLEKRKNGYLLNSCKVLDIPCLSQRETPGGKKERSEVSPNNEVDIAGPKIPQTSRIAS
jgi:hypothetical protein